MKIIVTIKSVYGKEMIYPVCEKAKLFASIAGKKTLDRKDISKIKELNFEIEVVFDGGDL